MKKIVKDRPAATPWTAVGAWALVACLGLITRSGRRFIESYCPQLVRLNVSVLGTFVVAEILLSQIAIGARAYHRN